MEQYQDRLFTRQEAAAYIGVQSNTLATWACTQRYDLRYVKVGRNVRYRKQDLDAFIQRNVRGALAYKGEPHDR
ncbi:helix-turn-helix domain-containing protein [Ralstonia sp. SET104]|uniref:helix-turn-helix domain-containing protein n=1 Tax=Ralstonia sp. SET104 TaxID=2448774 RepID=UPI001C891BBF|nr:helix-turn-helix domain-containing protein [Ralstonia sp. SET104]